MDPITLMLISMIPGLIQSGVGAFQGIKGNQLGKTDQPMMEIPDSITNMLKVAENLAGQRSAPGSNIARDRVSSDVASTMDQIANIQGGSGSALAGMANLFTAEQQALQGIDVQDQQFYQQNMAQLMDALKTMGGWEQTQWQTNVKDPFDKTMQAAAAMKGAGIENMFGGIGSMISGGLGGYMYGDGLPKTPPAVPQTMLPEGFNPDEFNWDEMLSGSLSMFPTTGFKVPTDAPVELTYPLKTGSGSPSGNQNGNWQDWLKSILPMLQNGYTPSQNLLYK